MDKNTLEKNFANLPKALQIQVINDPKYELSAESFLKLLYTLSLKERVSLINNIETSSFKRVIRSMNDEKLKELAKSVRLEKVREETTNQKQQNNQIFFKKAFFSEIFSIVKAYCNNKDPDLLLVYSILKIVRSWARKLSSEALKTKVPMHYLKKFKLEYQLFKGQKNFRNFGNTLADLGSGSFLEDIGIIQDTDLLFLNGSENVLKERDFDVYSKILKTNLGVGHRREVLNKISQSLSEEEYFLFSKTRSVNLLKFATSKKMDSFIGMKRGPKNFSRMMAFLIWDRVFTLVEVAVAFGVRDCEKVKLDDLKFSAKDLEKAKKFVFNKLQGLRKKKWKELVETKRIKPRSRRKLKSNSNEDGAEVSNQSEQIK